VDVIIFMVEETTKEMVLRFIKENTTPLKKISSKELARQMNINGDSISYQTLLKYVDILIAEDVIKTDDYGVLKLVWFDGKK
jgi:hypothetical protein